MLTIAERGNESLIILVWPDDTWALEEDYEEYGHMSDDYQRYDLYKHDDIVELSSELREEIISEIMGD